LHKKGLRLSFLRYELENTEVAREQVQQIDEGGHSFEIENMVEETLETNIITVNTALYTSIQITQVAIVSSNRGVHPPKKMMNIAYFPHTSTKLLHLRHYFRKIYVFWLN